MDLKRCVKVDLEGADMLGLDGGRKLLEKHAPYVIMEYVDTLTDYSLGGKRLNKYSILNFARKSTTFRLTSTAFAF